ncbi:hypothetical protein K8R43_02590 [archaeon]|nr:hypothetical protein [archaeon]
MKPSEVYREEGKKATLVIVVLAVLLLLVFFYTLSSGITGLVTGRVQEMEIEVEPQETEKPAVPAEVHVIHSLKADGFHVRYYNNGGSKAKVCDCFSFGEYGSVQGWAYLKECTEVDAYESVTMMLPREELDRIHKNLFGRKIRDLKNIGSETLGWCLPRQKVDYGWIETTEELPLNKAKESTACYEKEGKFVCTECFFEIGESHPSKCREMERTFINVL